MKLVSLVLLTAVSMAAPAAFAQGGSGQGPPHVKKAPVTAPATTAPKTSKAAAPVHAPGAAKSAPRKR